MGTTNHAALTHRAGAAAQNLMKGRVAMTFAVLAGIPFVGMIVAYLATVLIPIVGCLAIPAWLVACFYSVKIGLKLISAKGRALQLGEADAMAGVLKYVAWNPTEGVLFLKNKIISRVDEDSSDGGGLALLYPFLGEELALRIPLEIQTLRFEDRNVLTSEYVPLGIKCTVYWRVIHIEPFYRFVSREIHNASDTGGHSVVRQDRDSKLEAAEQWLKHIAEEETRKVFSRVSTGLLLAARVAQDVELPSARTNSGSSPASEYTQATEGLATTIFKSMNELVSQYGLALHRVALQEVELPPEICKAATDACKSYYLPLQAEREAAADRIKRSARLETDVSILGQDAVAAREVLSAAPSSPIAGLAGFLDDWLKRGGVAQGQQRLPRSPGTTGP